MTAVQVAGGSGRPPAGAYVGRVCCPAWAGTLGGGGAMTAGAAAVGCSEYGWVRKSVVVRLVRLGRGGRRGGRGAFPYLKHAQPRFAFPDVLFEGFEGRLGLQNRSGDGGFVGDKPGSCDARSRRARWRMKPPRPSPPGGRARRDGTGCVASPS